MSKAIPKRSTGGCLTCKRRRKKCDERRPHCRRCELGDFHCLGYGPPNTSYAGDSPGITQSDLIHWPSYASAAQLVPCSSGLGPLDAPIPLLDYGYQVERLPPARTLFREARNCLSNIPNKITLDPIVLEDATSLIVSQFTKFSQEILFKSPSGSIEDGVLWRIGDSDITRWSMYLSARVIKDISSGNNAWKYMDWIFRFFQQILETSRPLQRAGLAARLGGLHDLVNLAFLISGTATGYSLLKRCVPVLLQLAALNPTLWYNDSTISIPEGIANPRYEITQFIIYDTIIALSLGTPPLLHYNTAPSWVDEAPGHYQIMYGFPVGVLLLLAKVNEWRTSRIVGRVSQSQGEWCSLEERLNNWHPTICHTDGPNNNIARLAIQEAWRQAAMIYLYMGMREVNSADPRVETAVQQISQLVGIFKTGSVLELHLLVPYLIAGIAARRETHRAVLRSKLTGEMVRKVNVFIIRGSDFAAVLDHLWHGVGSQGRPVTWDNYVQSRCAVLPVV